MDSRMDIRSLLNSPRGGNRQCDGTTLPPSSLTQHTTPRHTVSKKQKLAKDAPIFADGTKPVGNVNYRPYEAGDDEYVQGQHRKFCIFPLGQIYHSGVRHIPYVSDKKHFKEKTGREAFEVFQYTFKVPGDDKEYLVVWDYNVGLVRMTPFFKSLKYSKTVPAKALNQNPGLKDISYSITGGALVCQGYWVPWQAARELAAKFCWEIRWALTPVFGNDFPQMCVLPDDHSEFGKFVISPATVRFCADETTRFMKESRSCRIQLPGVDSPKQALGPVFRTPAWQPGSFPSPSIRDGETDTDTHDKADYSSQVSPHSGYSSSRFTSVSRDATPISPDIWAYTPQCLPPLAPEMRQLRSKRTYSKVSGEDSGHGVDKTNTMRAATTQQHVDAASKENRVAEHTISLDVQAPTMCRHEDRSPSELGAAEILVALGVVGRNTAAFPQPKHAVRGSVVHSSVP